MKLKKEYRKSGYLVTYIKHEGDVYLYEKVAYEYDKDPGEKGDKVIPAGGAKPHWEVVIPQKHFPWKNVKHGSSDGWIYPRSSQWGRSGWTLKTRERAEEKFNEVVITNG